MKLHWYFDISYEMLFMLAIIAGIIILLCYVFIILPAQERQRNEAAPVRLVRARVSFKRYDPDVVGCSGYFVTFRAQDGTSRELEVDRQVYEAVYEGEWGDLSFRRKQFLSFTPQTAPLDAAEDGLGAEAFEREYPETQAVVPVVPPYLIEDTEEDIDPALFMRRYPAQPGSPQQRPVYPAGGADPAAFTGQVPQDSGSQQMPPESPA
ncbi:MAG: DUF2500 domain-containing protein [Oscillospiraceae bacterium]|nr:DUF2500 domain-containing protein [Oscillospiraceae bacterium]